MAGLLTTAFSFVITRMVAKRLTGTKSNPRILLHIISAEVAGISLVVLSIFSKMDGIIMLFVYGILSMAIFASVLWVLRELTQKDIDFILDTINPAKMRNYISDEIKK